MRGARLVFEGTVQGVSFRANTQRIAREMGLVGWVRNLPDGTVEAEVEGRKEDVEELIARLRREVRGARVKKVRVEWREGERDGGRELRVFEIRGDY